MRCVLCLRLIELLDFDQDSELFRTLHRSRSYHLSESRWKASQQDQTTKNYSDTRGTIGADHATQSTPVKGSSGPAPRSGNIPNSSEIVGGPVAVSVGADLAVGAVSLAGAASDWLSSFSSPTSAKAAPHSGNGTALSTAANAGLLTTPLSWLDNLAVVSGAAAPPPASLGNGLPGTSTEGSFAQERIEQAADMDYNWPLDLLEVVESQAEGSVTAAGSGRRRGDFSTSPPFLPLSLPQMFVWVNSMSVVCHGVEELIADVRAQEEERQLPLHSLQIISQV